MLTDEHILFVIKDFKRDYKGYKDNGDTFYKQLVKKLLNTIDNEKEEVLAFFLREIKYNQHELWGTALWVIKEMKAVEVCPRIIQIYNEEAQKKDDQWQRAVISLLMDFRYTPPQELYHNYVLKCMKKRDNPFYLLLLYYNVNKTEALIFLAKYLIKNVLTQELLTQPIEKIDDSLHGIYLFIDSLFWKFRTDTDDGLPKLLEIIYMQNPKAAIYFQTAIINWLKSNWTKHFFSKSWIENEIKRWNNFP